MPHFIVERCSESAETIEATKVLQGLHEVAVSTGIFDEKTIKVRLREYDQAFVAGQSDSFVHVTIYLIDGRDKSTKKRLASAVHDYFRQTMSTVASVSVDVRDLDREIYTKSQL